MAGVFMVLPISREFHFSASLRYLKYLFQFNSVGFSPLQTREEEIAGQFDYPESPLSNLIYNCCAGGCTALRAQNKPRSVVDCE